MLPINRQISLVNWTDRNTNPSYIVIHYVGAHGSTAKNNADYFYSTFRGASATFFVDERSIWQVVEENDSAWHCGAENNVYFHPYCRNSNSIGIEMCCYSNGDGTWIIADETVNNTVELTKHLMAKYGIPASNVLRHYDVTHKTCPEPFVRDVNAWNNFKASLGGSYVPTPDPTPDTKPSTGGDRLSGALFTCTGLWTQANGGVYYSANQLLYGKGDYTIGKVHTGAAHPYEALRNGTVVGFANDKCIDDEPSLPGGGTSAPSTPKYSVEQVAQEIVKGIGDWGNGDVRKQRVASVGLSYDEVQSRVNQLIGAGSVVSSITARQFASEVWYQGKHGTGAERASAAQRLGVDFNEAQRLINILASGGSI